MNAQATVQTQTIKPTFNPVTHGLLQRCTATTECAECRKKRLGTLQRAAVDSSPVNEAPPTVHEVLRLPGQSLNTGTPAFMEPRFGHDFSQIPTFIPSDRVLQTKLTINRPGDDYEQEADRIANQVMAASAHESVSETRPRIQRFTGQQTWQTETVPASVDQVLAGAGLPLEPTLRQDMESRFGQDFSEVRVHSDAAAAQSAEDVNANAYTVGNDIVFGASRFAPGTQAGRRLIAHELTHVVQQGAALKGKGHIVQLKSGGNLIQRAVTETKQESHAGLFELSTHTPLGGPAFAPTAQYSVRIEFTPYQVVDCDQIAMTQTVLSKSGGVLIYGSPARRSRSLTAAEGTEGLGIDRLSGRTSPLYGRNNTGMAAGNAHFGSRTGKAIGDKAWMTDTPGFNGASAASSRTAGRPLSQHFETCAICNAGKDTGVYYGCVNWGFDIDAADKFSEDNFALVSKGTPSTDFLAAAKKWNDQTVPVATDNLPLPTHKTKQTSMTEAQLKSEIKSLETTLKGLAAGHADIPQISFEIKVYKDILGAISFNKKLGYSTIDIKAIQAVVGTITSGSFDFDTIMKIKRWQVEKGLKGDGRFGAGSMTKLNALVMAALTANKGQGFRVDQIKKIQVNVASKDDGIWGPTTVKNLMVWQKDHSLPATGEFDIITKIFMFVFGGF